MMNRWKMWLFSVMAVFVLAACGADDANETPKTDKPDTEENETEVTETTYPLTMEDATGNEITLEEEPENIVTTMPSNTEILFELGLADEILAVSDNDDYPEEATDKEKIGGFELNIEAIVALDPDIVFGHESALSSNEEGYKQIEEAGIPVYVVKEAKNFDETYKTIEEIAELTNKQEEAANTIDAMKEKVDEVVEKVKGEEERTVFVETSPAPEIYTPGNNTFMQEMLDLIGAKNISDDQDDWFMMDPEEIVNRNPDVIIVMYDFVPTAVEDVYKRDGFDTITAIKEEQVIQVDENLTSRTGPRLGEGLEEVAKAIYPEAFGE